MDWLDLLAVQGTLKSLLQHHSSKASIFWRSAFFTVQLSHPYMTTGKTIALSRRTFVGKVMSLLFNMLSRLVITFLPRIKCLLISWLQSPSAVILEAPKIVWHCSHCFSIYFPWSDGTRCHDLSFLNAERLGFNSWVRKIGWRRDRLPTPVFWPGEFHGLYSLWGRKELDTTEWLSLSLSPKTIPLISSLVECNFSWQAFWRKAEEILLIPQRPGILQSGDALV